ncbi:12825_t:CDS:10 [Acaulospora colombiana]|uniref:12825_t:CDS:1 n=1 Tax=Acaulospora colombiana TaxID=27376 RepID=A0ACA9K2U0_9GLOM|nr:12825_t:CDS:10 [Acaulospora colombiana]
MHIVLCPFTKVEESFNLQATHDIIEYGISPTSLEQFDHFEFPGVVPRTFVGPLLLSGASWPTVKTLEILLPDFDKFLRQYVVRLYLGLAGIFALSELRSSISKSFGQEISVAFARVHLDVYTAMTGASRFGQLRNDWKYYKVETHSSPADYLHYTHLLTSDPDAHNETFETLDVVNANANGNFSRMQFRPRKIDNKKGMLTFLWYEVDEEAFPTVNRDNPEVVTGIEKGEDEELHFKTLVERKNKMIEKNEVSKEERAEQEDTKPGIPCPETGSGDQTREPYFEPNFKQSKTYRKFSTPIEECIGCEYNMDDADEKWLQEYNSKEGNNLDEDPFEEIIDFFERIAKKKPYLLAEKKLPMWEDCSKLSDKLIPHAKDAENVYTYWKAKRMSYMVRYKKVGPLMHEIKTVETKKEDEEDAYICFRRRELRPVRRTRRTEAQSFDKLKNIRIDLQSGREIVVQVQTREKVKKQKIEVNRKVFIMECKIKDMQRELGIKKHSQKTKNRKISTSQAEIFGQPRKNSIKSTKKDGDIQMTDVTDYPYLSTFKNMATTYYRKLPYSENAFRSRCGRGGRRRCVLDRLEVFRFRCIKEEADWKFKYDSDEEDDAFSDDDASQMECDDEEVCEDDKMITSENSIIWRLLTDEDYQNLSSIIKSPKDKQSSPKHQIIRDDGHSGGNGNGNLLVQSSTENRLNVDNRTSIQVSQSRPNPDGEMRVENRANSDSRTSMEIDQCSANILQRSNLDFRSVDQRPSSSRSNFDNNAMNSRINSVQRDSNGRITPSNIDTQTANDQRAFVDPRTFNNVAIQRDQQQINGNQTTPRLNINNQITGRGQNSTSDPANIRETLINGVPFSGRDQRSTSDQSPNGDQRLSSESPRSNIDPRANLAHNGHTVRPSISANHRDSAVPYRNNLRNARVSKDSTTIASLANHLTQIPNARNASVLSSNTGNLVSPNMHMTNQGSVVPVSVVQIQTQVTPRQRSVPSQSVSNQNLIFNATSQAVTPMNSSRLSRTGSNPGAGMVIGGVSQVVSPMNGTALTRSGSNPGVVMSNNLQVVSPMTGATLSRSGSNPGAVMNAGQAIDPRRLQRTSSNSMLMSNHNLMIASTNSVSRTASNTGVMMVDPAVAQHAQSSPTMMINSSSQLIDSSKINNSNINIGPRVVMLNGQPTLVSGAFLNGGQVQSVSSPAFVSGGQLQSSPLNLQTSRPNMGVQSEQFTQSPQDSNSPISHIQRRLLMLRQDQRQQEMTTGQNQTSNCSPNSNQPRSPTQRQTQGSNPNQNSIQTMVSNINGTTNNLSQGNGSTNGVIRQNISVQGRSDRLQMQTIPVSNASQQQTHSIVTANGSVNLRQKTVPSGNVPNSVVRQVNMSVSNGSPSFVPVSGNVNNMVNGSVTSIMRHSSVGNANVSSSNMQQSGDSTPVIRHATNPTLATQSVHQSNVVINNMVNRPNSATRQANVQPNTIQRHNNYILPNGTSSVNMIPNTNASGRQMILPANSQRPTTPSMVGNIQTNGAQNINAIRQMHLSAFPGNANQLTNNAAISNYRQSSLTVQAPLTAAQPNRSSATPMDVDSRTSGI